jgi:hypothetical protein
MPGFHGVCLMLAFEEMPAGNSIAVCCVGSCKRHGDAAKVVLQNAFGCEIMWLVHLHLHLQLQIASRIG